MTPSKIFGVCLAILVAGIAIGVGLPAPQPSDYLRGLEAAVLVVTGVVIFWYTVETRELRITSDAQLALAREREGADERSAKARAGLIAFALRRQVVSWLTPEISDFDGGGDAGFVALERRFRSKAFWTSVREAETRLERLVEIAPTLSSASAASVTAVVRSFYQAMDGANGYFDAYEASLETSHELEAVRSELTKTAERLAADLIPDALREAGNETRLAG